MQPIVTGMLSYIRSTVHKLVTWCKKLTDKGNSIFVGVFIQGRLQYVSHAYNRIVYTGMQPMHAGMLYTGIMYTLLEEIVKVHSSYAT